MSISLQNTIINNLKSTLQGITISNGFQTDVKKVFRGVRGLDDFTSAYLPGLTIFRTTHETIQKYGGGTEGKYIFKIWGFTKVDARQDDYDNLDKLVADVEKVLMDETTNQYMTDTFIGDTNFYEGGVQDSFGFFNMEVQVNYMYDLDEI